MNQLLALPVQRPRAALALAAGLTFLALWSTFSRLKPEASLQGLLDRTDPAVIALGDVLEQFPVVSELLMLVSLPANHTADDPAPLLAFAERLRAAAALDAYAEGIITQVRWQADSQARQFVESVMVPNGLYYLSDEQAKELSRRLTRDGMREQLARNQAMLSAPGPAAGAIAKRVAKDPLRLHEFLLEQLRRVSLPGARDGAFLSPDRRSLLIRIGGRRSPGDFTFAREMTALVARLAAAENRDGLRIDIGGAYAMAAHSARRIQADSIADIVMTVIGLVILFVLACRHPVRLFLFAFVPVAIGILWGFGAYAIVQHTITPLAAVVGGTLGAIGLDYTIHYIAHFQEIRQTATSIRDAALRTSRELFMPSLAAWLTSVIGFAAVAISPVQVLRDFAILGTLCLIGAWLATLLIVPAMLSSVRRERAARFEIRFDLAAWIGRWISRHARALIVASCVAISLLLAVPLVRGVRYQIESDPMVLHPQPSPPLEAQRQIAHRMQIAGGALIVYLRGDSPQNLLSLSHEVQRRLDTAAVRGAGVASAFGLPALLPDPRREAARRALFDSGSPQRAEADLREALAASEFRPAAFEDYIKFLQTLATPVAPPDPSILRQYPEFAQLLLPRDVIEGNAPATRAVTLIFTHTPLETREAREAALRAVRDALNDLPGVTVTGTAVIGQDLETAMRRDLPRFVAIALVFIAGYLLLQFRSIKLAGMSLLPIAISLLCVVVVISLGNLKLNLLHTVMAPLLLGINLDFGIFAVHAWRSSRDAGELSQHFPASFAALVICGGSTIIGFGSLVVTSIPAVESLGWLINVGVGTCVLGTLLVLWPIMMIRRRKHPVAEAEPT